MKPLLAMLSVIAPLLASPGTARADDQTRFSLSPVYREECGSCHLPYPPRLLPAQSWKALMAGLDKHFGSNASMDGATAKAIADFLTAQAGRPERLGAAPATAGGNLRITETAWFKREHRDGHDGLSASLWQSSAVQRPSNCAACHRQAAEGDYSERGIRIPRSH